MKPAGVIDPRASLRLKAVDEPEGGAHRVEGGLPRRWGNAGLGKMLEISLIQLWPALSVLTALL